MKRFQTIVKFKYSDFKSDIQKIMVGPDDPIDPGLQKELNLVKDLLANTASTEVPLFTPYFTKAQKKKEVKVAYLTRSQGPLHHLPNDGIFGEPAGHVIVVWFDTIPSFLSLDFFRDMNFFPNYRFP